MLGPPREDPPPPPPITMYEVRSGEFWEEEEEVEEMGEREFSS